MILTHATGAKENQMFLAIVPQYGPTPIRLHSYEFKLPLFQMSKLNATLYRACIPRDHFEDFTSTPRAVQANTLFPRVESMVSL